MVASVAARPGERLDRVRRMAAGILIVEDDRNIGDLVRTYLERDGYRVVWVRSGEDGLAELERQRPEPRGARHRPTGHRRLRGLPPPARAPARCR